MTDQVTPAGATPVVAGATPAQTPPAATGAPSTTTPAAAPATGADADLGLGDAGREALRRERDARAAAEKARNDAVKELETLRAATQSDSEKAIAQARKEGASEVLTRVQGQIRASEVKAALTAAGVNPTLIGLAAKGDEFAELKVSDDGQVEGLTGAIATFRETHKDLFVKGAVPAAGTGGGSFDTGTGAGGRPAGKPTYTREQLRDTAFFTANRADILAAQKEGRITN